MKKQIKLQWKIGSYLLIFAVIVIAVIYVFQSMLLQPMYEQSRRESVSVVSDSLKTLLESGDFDDPEDYSEELMMSSAQNDVCIQIFEVDDYSWRQTDVNNGGCALFRLRPDEIRTQIRKAAESKDKRYFSDGEVNIKTPENANFRNIICTQIVESDDDLLAVMVTAGITPINATTGTLRTQMLYIMLIMFVLILGLTLILNRRIARPIRNITENAKELSHGEYAESRDHTAYAEVDELNSTLVQAAMDIRKADKARNDLIANVSHDLRTPLTMISGYGEMMIDLPEEKNDENLRVIVDESRRLNALVNDLLDLSKMEENRIELSPTVFDMKDLIEEQIRKYDVYRLQEGFEITAETTEGGLVSADRGRIEQVFNNFMTNAIHYSGDVRRITVTETVRDGKVRVSVQDCGEGIAREDLPKVWDRYFKVDKTHVRLVNGSGIGLSICRRILEMHHAGYGAESEVGKGSEFWFELPQQKQH